MTAFLVVIILLLAVWIARHGSRLRRSESLIAQLTQRVFRLEQEAPRPRVAEPIPAAPPPEVAPLPPPAFAASPPPELPASSPIPTPTIAPAAAPAPGFSFRSILNLEETLGTNWLNKLGIIILVIGLALFLAYQVRELGPLGKVILGYAISFALLGCGVFFERREQWRVLARTAIAGGWAMLYFTTYALNHVAAARVLSSEAVDFILLFVVACAMVLHTLRYASQVVTGLAFLLAFTTVNISRGDVYSLFASALLAAALAAIAVRRSWFELELAGMTAAYLNHYLWLRPIIEPMHGSPHPFPGFTASAALLCGYWVVFRASYLLRRIEDQTDEQLSTLAAILNPALLLGVMHYQSVHPELAFRFLLLLGAVEFILGQLPIARRRRTAFIVLSTLGSCLLVAAIPFRFSGGTLSAVWLAEAEALLLAGVFLKEIVFRYLGLAASLVLWTELLVTLTSAPPDPRQAALASFAALLFYLNSQVLPRRFLFTDERDLEHFVFTLLAHFAGVLAALLIWYELTSAAVALGWSLLALVLFEMGLRLRSLTLRSQAYIAFTLSFLRLFVVNLNASSSSAWSPRVLTIVPIAIAFYYVYARLTSAGVTPAPRERKWRIASIHSFFGTLALAALLRFELDPDFVVLAWAALVLSLTAFARFAGRRIFLDQALLIAFAVLFRGVFHNLYERSYFPAPFFYSRTLLVGSSIVLLLLTLPFAFALRQTMPLAPTRTGLSRFLLALDRRPEQVFFFIAFILCTILLAVEMRSGLVTLAWGVQAFATFALALWMKERSFRLAALGLLLLCVLKIVVRDVWGLAPSDRYLTFIGLGSALLAVSYLYTRYRQVLRQYL
jgi:hypothetical protein